MSRRDVYKPDHVKSAILRRGRMLERRVFDEFLIKTQIVLFAYSVDI